MPKDYRLSNFCCSKVTKDHAAKEELVARRLQTRRLEPIVHGSISRGVSLWSSRAFSKGQLTKSVFLVSTRTNFQQVLAFVT